MQEIIQLFNDPSLHTHSQAPTHILNPDTHLPAGSRVIASPYAKKLALQAGVSLVGVAGSGPGGRIVASDVQQLVASGGGAPAAAAAPAAAHAAAAPSFGEYTDLSNSQIKKVGFGGGFRGGQGVFGGRGGVWSILFPTRLIPISPMVLC